MYIFGVELLTKVVQKAVYCATVSYCDALQEIPNRSDCSLLPERDSFILKSTVKIVSALLPSLPPCLFLALRIPESICGHFLLRPSTPTSCLSSLKSSEDLAPERSAQRWRCSPSRWPSPIADWQVLHS